MSQTKRPVEIYTARGEAEAQIIKGLLESYGIPSILKSRAAPSVHVFAVDGMGEVSVMVSADDEAAARELVRGEDNV